MKINMRVKLSILIGGLTFIVALFVGNYANNISSLQLENKAGETLTNLAKHTAEILDREMLERYREIQFAATSPILRDENTTIEERRAFLEQLKNNQKHHEWIGFALPDGTVQVGTNGYLEGKNAKARPWLPGGLQGPYIGDVHDALLLAKLMPNTSGESIYFTDVAFPVKNKQGEVSGVLVTHLMWQWTRDIIRSIQKENEVEIFLLAKDGMILVGPEDTERKNISDISKNAATLFTSKDEYKTIDWSNNVAYLTAHTISQGFEEYKGFEWRVLVRQPIKYAFNDAKHNTQLILSLSIVVALFGVLIGVISAQKITSPIKELHKQILHFKEKGTFNLQKVKSLDEISDLQNALVELYENLTLESTLKQNAQEKVQLSLQIFDQSLEGIVITNNENKIILVNKAFEKITGYSQEEVYLKNPSILNSGQHDKTFYENMWKAISDNGKWEGTIFNAKKDGSVYEEHLRISTLKDEKGNINFYLATFNSGF